MTDHQTQLAEDGLNKRWGFGGYQDLNLGPVVVSWGWAWRFRFEFATYCNRLRFGLFGWLVEIHYWPGDGRA